MCRIRIPDQRNLRPGDELFPLMDDNTEEFLEGTGRSGVGHREIPHYWARTISEAKAKEGTNDEDKN